MRLGMGLGLGNLLSGQPLTGFPNDFSFNFDGSNDYLALGNINYDMQSGIDSTVSIWVKFNAVNTTQAIWDQGNGSASGSNRHLLYLNSDGTIHFYNLNKDVNAGSVSADTWYNIIVTTTGSTKKAKVFINGVASGETDARTTNVSGYTVFNIGKNSEPSEAGQYLNALVDEFAMWNTVLSDENIAKIASKPVDFSKASTYATDVTSNLILWLRAGDKVEPEASIARSDFYTDFDGTDDFIEAGQSNNLGTGTDYTISCWLKNLGTTRAYAVQLQKGLGSSNLTLQLNANSTVDSAGYVSIFLYDGGALNYVNADAGINDNNWHHVAITTTSSAQVIYVDGKSIQTGTQSFSNSFSEHPISIGRAYNVSNLFYEGALSNLSIYQTALDAQTIKQFAKSRYTPMRDNRFSVVDFDGSDDRITTNVNSTLTDGTYIFWVKATETGANKGVFGHGGDQAGAFSFNWSSNRPLLYLGANRYRFWNDNSAQDDGVWHCWAVVLDADDMTGCKLYVDGVEQTVNSTSNSGDYVSYSTGLTIGSDSVNYAECSIAQFAVYSDLKDSDFIYAQWSKGITADYSSDTNLIGYWRMGDDTSKAYPTIADSSSNSNDGTMTSMASDDIVQQAVAMYDMGAFESTGQEVGGDTLSGVGIFNTDTTSSWSAVNTSISYNSSGFMRSVFSGTSEGGVHGGAVLTIGNNYNVTFQAKSNRSVKITSIGDYENISTTVLNPTLTTSFQNYEFNISPTQTLFRIYIASGGSADDFLDLKDIRLKEVLQSTDVSDTYPAIIDVNEPVLGAELITNSADRDFSSDTGFWSKAGGWSINTTENRAEWTTASGGSALSRSSFFTSGKTYKITMTVTGSTLPVYVGNANTAVSFVVGTTTHYITQSGGNNDLWLYKSAGTTGTVTDISIKEVQGNVGTMTNQDSADLVYSSVLPDQSFLTGVNSAYNFIDLGGTDEYISVDSVISDIATQTGTINLWAMPTSDNGAEQMLFTYNNNSTRTDLLFRYSWGEDKINVGIAQSGAQKWFAYSATNSVSSHLNNWNMITLVHDGTESKLYANGSELSLTYETDTDKTFWLGDMSGVNKVSIGIFNYTSLSNAFIGKISQSAVWNKNLSASEILAIYNLGRHGNLSDKYSEGLKGYWGMSSLDASTGLSDVGNGTIYDRSGQSNHGTATNTESADLASSPNAEPHGYAKGDTNRSTTIP